MAGSPGKGRATGAQSPPAGAASPLSAAASLLSFAVYVLLLPWALLARIAGTLLGPRLPRPPTFADLLKAADACERTSYAIFCDAFDLLAPLVGMPKTPYAPPLSPGAAVLVAHPLPLEDLVLALCEDRTVLVPASAPYERRLAALAGNHAPNLRFLPEPRGADWSETAAAARAALSGSLGAQPAPLLALVVSPPPDAPVAAALQEAGDLLALLPLPAGRAVAVLPLPASPPARALSSSLPAILSPPGIRGIAVVHGRLKIRRRGSLPGPVARQEGRWPAVDPRDVTAAAMHALQGRRPLPRYAVGVEARAAEAWGSLFGA